MTRTWVLIGYGLVVAIIAVTAGAAYATTGLMYDRPTYAWHWDKPAVVDGRTIHLTFAGGSCDEKRWVEVLETDTSVTLTVKQRQVLGTCIGTGLTGLRLDAKLKEPLGDRTLVDGACLGGDEPLRGNCPRPVQTGSCGTAAYRVDLLVDEHGQATLRARLNNSAPGEAWHFQWTYRDYRVVRIDHSTVRASSDGELVATRAMGRLPAELNKLRQVEFAPTGETLCRVRGHMPMSYGS